MSWSAVPAAAHRAAEFLARAVETAPEAALPVSPSDLHWEAARWVLSLVAAVVVALAVDRLAARRGLLPPGFRTDVPGGGWRRLGAGVLLAFVFWVGIFAAFGVTTPPEEVDLSAAGPWTLFALHAVIAATLLAWGVLAFPRRLGAGASRGESPLLALARAIGFAEERPGREIRVGFVTGLLIWAAVLAVVTALAVVLELTGRGNWLPEGPPELVVFIASQPFWARVLGSLSAGFVEEAFFRGFLQPRVGVAFSTLLFALAHWSYGEPFMLVGVTLLSLTYAFLARWRGSVWAAATAHAVFDGVQLLVLIPLALRDLPQAAAWAF